MAMNNLFDPFQESLTSNPYPVYRSYLDAGAIHLGKPPMPEYPESWYVFGYKEAAEVLRNPLFVHDRSAVVTDHQFAGGLPDDQLRFWQLIGNWFLLIDPPRHTAQRSCVAHFFSRANILHVSKLIDSVANELLDSALSKGGLDVVWDYAYPLSVRIVSHLLGIPSPEIPWFKSCTRQITLALSIRDTTRAYDGAASSLVQLLHFIDVSRRECGAGNSEESVLSHLLSRFGSEGSPDRELIDSVMTLLLVVGQETVSDSIGTGMITLFNHPEECERLRRNPELVSAAVEELLRFEPPLQYAITRTASTDILLGDVQFRQGDPVTVVLGAACRDPRRYVEPDRFDLSRTTSADTLVFGKGIHLCLGIHLARLTLEIAFSKLFTRLPAYWTISEAPTWRDNISLRGPSKLLIEF